MIFNLVGTSSGGGGGFGPTDAVLRVIAPASSVVTISKGAITQTADGRMNADDNSRYNYYFVIKSSEFDGVTPWTVTVTKDGKTQTASVIIDAAEEYDVALDLGWYLVYGGLTTSNGITRYATGNTVEQHSGYVSFVASANNTVGIYSSTNKVDLTGYSTLTLVTAAPTGFSYGGNTKVPLICIGSNRPTTTGSSSAISNIVASQKIGSGSDVDIAPGTVTMDISSYSGEYYIAITMAGISSKRFEANILKFGVEI